MTTTYQTWHSRWQKGQEECTAQHRVMDFTLGKWGTQHTKQAPNSTFLWLNKWSVLHCIHLQQMKALKQSKYALFAIKLCELCSNGAGHSFSSGLWVMWPITIREMSLAHVYTSGWTDGSIHTILLSPHKSNMMGQIHLTLHFREHIIENSIFPAFQKSLV